MKGIPPIFCLFGLLWIAGCTSLSGDPKLVGAYAGETAEELIFISDGRVFHVQTANGKESRSFLGYYASGSNDSLRLGFVGPDTSPFVGTSFQFSEDRLTVTASWDGFGKPKDAWQVTYRKVPKAN